MAITTEQSKAIDNAINNLNKSAEVNTEVLNLVKSMETTGSAASVAEHKLDPRAHAKLNELQLRRVYVTTDNSGVGNTPTSISGVTLGTLNSGPTGVFVTSDKERAYLSFYYSHQDMGVFDKNLGVINFCDNFIDAVTDTENNVAYGRIIGSTNAQGAFFYKFALKHSDGHDYVYKLTTNAFAPLTAGNMTYIGEASSQWEGAYLKTSPIVSSDKRLKQDIEEIPEAVFKAWEKINFYQYHFKNAIEEKGDKARLHIGVIAQDIIDAFTSQGLDATTYGIVCHDTWEDQYQDVEVGTKPATYNEQGEEVTPEEPIMERQLVKKAGDIWTVRYEELLALESAYQRWKLKKLEAMISDNNKSNISTNEE